MLDATTARPNPGDANIRAPPQRIILCDELIKHGTFQSHVDTNPLTSSFLHADQPSVVQRVIRCSSVRDALDNVEHQEIVFQRIFLPMP